MKRFVVTVVASLFMIGCGSSHSILKPMQQPTSGVKVIYYVEGIADPNNNAPEHMRIAVLGYLKKDLESKGLLAQERGQANRLVTVTITSYRMRSGFTRAMFGFMAGKDGMGANVCVRDSSTNEVVGESEVSCYNLAAVGSEEDIARMEGQEIGKYLSEKRG